MPDGAGDAPTISAGEDSAAHGDTLLLADGLYSGAGNKDTYVFNKRVIFRSESGDPEACIIDCGGSGTCITFSGYYMPGYPDTPATGCVEGVTITGASTAVRAYQDASAVVIDCIITGCTGVALSAVGVPAQGYASIWASRCLISSNAGYTIDGGYKCNATATECVFCDNGGVLTVPDTGYGRISRCTVVSNARGSGGLINGGMYSSVEIENSVIAYNTGTPVTSTGYELVLECSDVYANSDGDYIGAIGGMNGVDGNFSEAPKFCDISGRNLTVETCSPCLPGSHPQGYDCGDIIGALASGCECGTAASASTWGEIKSFYR
jgi:hypothetical protein